MGTAIKIVKWLSENELEAWLNEAPTAYEYRRRLAVSLTARFRFPAATLASMLVVDERTVRRWLHEYNQQGPKALGPDQRGGRHRGFLEIDEEKRVLQSLHERAEKGEFVTVEELRSEVEAHIRRHVSASYLLHLVHRHGWRKLVPRPRHPKSDPVRMAQYRHEFPNLLQRLVRAAKTHLPIRVLFEDEATFGRISEIYSSWVPPRVRPLVAKQQVREFIYVLGASCPFDGASISSLSQTLDHFVVGDFLKRVAARFSSNYCIVFLDRSGPHIDGELKVPARVHVERLPSKSPELNPEEHIWDHIREKHFANKLFPSMATVISELRRALRSLAIQPELVRSMTSFPWILTRTF
jgi:transposase